MNNKQIISVIYAAGLLSVAPCNFAQDSAQSLVESLGSLSQLHDSGVLTDEEFNAAKRRLLGLPVLTQTISANRSVERQPAALRLPLGAYVGEVNANGVPNGEGTLTYKTGSIYEGEFKDGEQWGRGVLRRSGGQVLDGYWQGNRFSPDRFPTPDEQRRALADQRAREAAEREREEERRLREAQTQYYQQQAQLAEEARQEARRQERLEQDRRVARALMVFGQGVLNAKNPVPAPSVSTQQTPVWSTVQCTRNTKRTYAEIVANPYSFPERDNQIYTFEGYQCPPGYKRAR
jgi:hypothetical protein